MFFSRIGGGGGGVALVACMRPCSSVAQPSSFRVRCPPPPLAVWLALAEARSSVCGLVARMGAGSTAVILTCGYTTPSWFWAHRLLPLECVCARLGRGVEPCSRWPSPGSLNATGPGVPWP
uniref:Hypothetical secreted protein 84 n=1 Tax=Amblyomma variegatum TaxID=34610 RepID=F0JA87_AMBVA|nr:TPA_inf: hypothetical secreted protein 84 [Amblyomma variegatum]